MRSTVRPGQLPTLACDPVKRLKSVDLPVLGMPNMAIRFIVLSRERCVCVAHRAGASLIPCYQFLNAKDH